MTLSTIRKLFTIAGLIILFSLSLTQVMAQSIKQDGNVVISRAVYAELDDITCFLVRVNTLNLCLDPTINPRVILGDASIIWSNDPALKDWYGTLTQNAVDYPFVVIEDEWPNPMDGTISNRTYWIDPSNNGECSLFNLHLINGERYTICLDPTDQPNANNGSVQNVTMTSGSYWSGELTQAINGVNHTFPFLIVNVTIHRSYVPVVIR